jgi:hypothetical protein
MGLVFFPVGATSGLSVARAMTHGFSPERLLERTILDWAGRAAQTRE